MNSVDSTVQPVATVNSRAFYAEYHGHKVKHLEKILPALRSTSDSIIWLAGDSSLDNKYWFPTSQDAVPGAYAQVLRPPVSKCDINYWLNYLALQRFTNTTEQQNKAGNTPSRRRFAAMNTAVEATTLNQRVFHLTQQDEFIRDNITKEDILIVSIGGNDIALLPSPCTIAAIMGLILCTPQSCLEGGFTCCSIPLDDCCCGCGPSFLSCAGGCPPCLSYFRHMFGTRVESYIKKLTRKTKPELILVCMIYYPDEAMVPSSWANPALSALGYNNNPKKLQLIIRKVFEEAIR